jgi:cation transport regulator ChaC
VLFVFGYGSLANRESVALTLGHAVDRSAFVPAELRGRRRAWNVGSDKDSHPERTFRLADGTEYDGLTVVLGLEPGDRCAGVVFPVTVDDLVRLDVRERNYDRIDVTDDVVWASRPPDCTIYTYTPKKTAMEKIAVAQASRRRINVRRGYVELAGEAPDIPYPVEDMTVEG